MLVLHDEATSPGPVAVISVGLKQILPGVDEEAAGPSSGIDDPFAGHIVLRGTGMRASAFCEMLCDLLQSERVEHAVGAAAPALLL